MEKKTDTRIAGWLYRDYYKDPFLYSQLVLANQWPGLGCREQKNGRLAFV